MEDNRPGNRHRRIFKLLLIIAIAGALVSVVTVSALLIYLDTPHAARLISERLGLALGQRVTVAGIAFRRGALQFKDISIANPSGFEGTLAHAAAVEVVPFWNEVVRGERSLRLVRLTGFRLNAVRSRSGEWNFTLLQRSLASRKGGRPAPFRIAEISIQGGDLLVGAHGVRDLQLRIRDLVLNGPGTAVIAGSFRDTAGNPYGLSGTGRGGAKPDLELVLQSTQFSVTPILESVSKRPLLRDEPPGSLRVEASLAGNLLRTGMRWELKGGRSAAGGPLLRGSLEASARYDSGRDEARLDNLVVSFPGLVNLQATGTVHELRAGRRFLVEVATGEVDLEPVVERMAPGRRGGTGVSGRFGPGRLTVAGDAVRGITSLAGYGSVGSLALVRGGRQVFRGVGGDFRIGSSGGTIILTGGLQGGAAPADALVQNLRIPLRGKLTPKLKPLDLRVGPFSVHAAGAEIRGNASYRPGDREPLQLSLASSRVSLEQLAPLLVPHGAKGIGGTLSFSFEAAGASPGRFSGAGSLEAAGLRGTLGGQSGGLERGMTDFLLRRSAEGLELSGDVRLAGIGLGGGGGDAAFGYRMAGDQLALTGGTFRAGTMSGGFRSLAMRIPYRGASLSATLQEGTLRRGELSLGPLTAGLQGDLLKEGAARWFSGSVHFEPGKVLWQGKHLASPTLRAEADRSGARGTVGGTLLGGSLDGKFSFDPRDTAKGVTFDLNIRRAGLAAAAGLIPPGRAIYPSDGYLDLFAGGSFIPRSGLHGRMTVNGRGLAIGGRGGRTLVSGSELLLSGEMSGQNVLLHKGQLRTGEAVLNLEGGLERFSPEPRGSFRFTLPRVSMERLVEPLLNLVPRLVQEAVLTGAVGAGGTLDLTDSGRIVSGTVELEGVGVEHEARQLFLAGLTGRIPVSIDLASKNSGRSFETLSFTRENYPRLLARFLESRGVPNLTAEGLRLGPLDLGRVALTTGADNGVTRIELLESTLFGGNLFGRGAVSVDRGLSWRGDLLLEEVSLRLLCERFPAIRGYISGLVGGVISVDGSGSGLGNIAGYAELWAKEGIGEKMLISREFLQKLSGKKLSGFFFRNDRPYDRGEIVALLEQGYLTFDRLDIGNTNIFGVRDLSVTIAPGQNRIALDHLLETVRQAAARGKGTVGSGAPAGEQEAPTAVPEFQWQE